LSFSFFSLERKVQGKRDAPPLCLAIASPIVAAYFFCCVLRDTLVAAAFCSWLVYLRSLVELTAVRFDVPKK